VTWTSLADTVVGDGEAEGPAGINEADAAGGVGDGDSGADAVGARATGKHALAITVNATTVRKDATLRRIDRL
jgi:hypothetical protein